MKNDNEENLKMFENIGNHQIFSRYSGELNRIFKDRSFEKFYGNLVSNRKHKSDDLLKYFGGTDDEMKRFSTYTEQRQFNPIKYKKFLKELDLEEEKEKEKLRTYRNQFKITKEEDENILREKDEKRKKIRTDRLYFKYPDMGKYKPNYRSVRKNLPRIYLSKYQFDPIKKYPIEGRNLWPIKKDDIPIKLTTCEKFMNDMNLTNEEKEEIKLSKTYDFSKMSKIPNKNKVMRFDYYTSRKPLNEEPITKNIVSTLDLPSTCSPQYIKGLIQFHRMSTDIENTKFIPDPDKIKDPNPPLGIYKPNYKYLENNYRDIYIKRNPLVSRKSQVKKLMYNYKVPVDYQIVDKLNSIEKK